MSHVPINCNLVSWQNYAAAHALGLARRGCECLQSLVSSSADIAPLARHIIAEPYCSRAFRVWTYKVELRIHRKVPSLVNATPLSGLRVTYAHCCQSLRECDCEAELWLYDNHTGLRLQRHT